MRKVSMLDWRGRFARAIKAIGLLGGLWLTNPGFYDRCGIFFARGETIKLVSFLGLWGICVLGLAAAAFTPNAAARVLWAALIAVGTSIAVLYREITDSELTPTGVLSLWHARHEAERALANFSSALPLAITAFALTFIVIAWPLPNRNSSLRKATAWLPAFPILLIATIMFATSGRGATALPRQFAQLSIGLFSAAKLATARMPPRDKVGLNPERELTQRIVMLVDESVRADYISLEPGNEFTPRLAANRDRFVDFGPAASGANCSAPSNAILRFAASRRDLANSVQASPTIWQYAKAAGYRTVYIDAQSSRIKAIASHGARDKLQNYMTLPETLDIDEFYAFENNIVPANADFLLLDIIAAEMAKPGKTFIYANKAGAHFPYEWAYPSGDKHSFPRPEGNADAVMIGHYRNVLLWKVDRFFEKFFSSVDLRDSVVLYTSDHGQRFKAGKSTHCNVADPDPREGLVPLMVAASDLALRRRFEEGARINYARADHFAITPSVLTLMGYRPGDLEAIYSPSLFEPIRHAAAFTSGSFGYFLSEQVRWNLINLTADYLERPLGAAKDRPGERLQPER